MTVGATAGNKVQLVSDGTINMIYSNPVINFTASGSNGGSNWSIGTAKISNGKSKFIVSSKYTENDVSF